MIVNEKKLYKLIKQAVTEALTVEVTMEKVKDDKTGLPLAVKETTTKDVFLPSMLVELFPFYESAIRGMQEDLNKNNNKINNLEDKIKSVGNIMIQTENSLKCIAAMSDHIKQINIDNIKQIKGD